MIRKNTLFLMLALLCNQNMNAQDQDDIATQVAKAVGGAAIGGAIGYAFNYLSSLQMIAEHENKMKFLEDLKFFIESDEYRNTQNGRLFTHYYNGLNQLAQTTPGVSVSLLQEFSQCVSDADCKELLVKIEQLQSQLQATHESIVWWGKVAMTVIGAISGSLASGVFDKQDDFYDHCSRPHSTTYVSSYVRSVPRNSFFSAR